MMRHLNTACLTTAFLLVGCFSKAEAQTACSLTSPEGKSIELVLEVQDDDAERAEGLMFRKTLGSNAGMLFIWPEAAQRSMWMKNTFLPLDMVFLRDHRIVGIIENTMPFSETILTVETPANRVLEVNAGSLKAWGVTHQWRLNCQP